jgi:hypothetical protein
MANTKTLDKMRSLAKTPVKAGPKAKAPVKTVGLKANALPSKRGQTRVSTPIDELGVYTTKPKDPIRALDEAATAERANPTPAAPGFSDAQLIRVLTQLGLAKPIDDEPAVGGPAATQRKSVDLFDKDGNPAVVLSDSDVARIAAAVGLKVSPVKTAERSDRDPVAAAMLVTTAQHNSAGYVQAEAERRFGKVELPCTDDRSPIMRSMDELDSSLFAMEESWQNLLRKLAPVLPEDDDAKGNGRIMEAAKSQLHRRVLNQKDRIESMTAALNYVTSTVTVF